jgi:hypothetical protein
MNKETFLEKVQNSIDSDYLIETFTEVLISYFNEHKSLHPEFVVTDNDYIIHECDAIITNCDRIFHQSNDTHEFMYDEIDEEYIIADEAESVQDRRRTFYTHRDNLSPYNSIYWFSGQDTWVTEDYMQWHNIVVMRCGTLEYSDDVYFWESDSEWHYEEEIISGKINSYSYKPEPFFYSLKNEKNPVYFGLELEVENETDDISNRKASIEIDNIFGSPLYMKTDGSLSNGFEIVSHPLSFDYINSKKETFEKMLTFLSDNGFRSYNSRTCGMHIHISKSSFTTWQLYRFMEFFQKNRDFIVRLSQRELANLNKWAALSDDNTEAIVYKAKSAKLNKGGISRYSAINICNSHTVEIRIFRGTLAPGSFFKNIEFCAALFEFTRDNLSTDIANFKTFVQNKPEFKNLAKFIKLKNL